MTITLRSLSLLSVCGVVACATAPETKPAGGDAPLAGCVLSAGPTALCDGGKVMLDVATVSGSAAERIATVQRASSFDGSWLFEDGAAVTGADGAVTRTDRVHPMATPTATVGTVTFFAPRDGDRVVSCADFVEGDARCGERALALLATTVPEGATLQHKPTATLPTITGCSPTDAPYAVQQLCTGGEKVSVVGIRGNFGPASTWWLLQRVVQSQATEVRGYSTCPVQGQMGYCGVALIKDRPALFGAVVGRDELHITACFAGGPVDGVPPVCSAIFGEVARPDTRRLLSRYDVRFDGCAYAQPDGDSFDASVVCESGDVIAQVARADVAGVLVDKLVAERAPAQPSEQVACKVRGVASTCTRTVTKGRTLWRADVDDPRVAAFVCGSTEATPAAICEGFIEAAP